jgi:hypothetical protein
VDEGSISLGLAGTLSKSLELVAGQGGKRSGVKMGLRCPKCRSTRIRRGYEKPPLLLRIIGWQGLLCDNCNLSYQGFAVPGTVPKHTSRSYKRKRKAKVANEPPDLHSEEGQEEVTYAHRLRLEDRGVKASDVISFSWYYIKLQVRVILGLHQTSHSLGVKYRWHNWLHWQRNKRL